VKMSHMQSLINLNTNLEALVKQRTEELHHEKELLRIASTTDPLTKLYNRHRMDEVFDTESRTMAREGEPLSVILIDVDHFKRVNDIHGHNVGDTFLKEIAGLLRDAFRKKDTIGRWGGEEFLIFLPRTRLNEAQALAERLRHMVEHHAFSKIGKQSISAGVATMVPGEALKSLIHRADEALYSAKKSGRNLVMAG